MRVSATATVVLGIVGAVLVILLTVHEPLIFAVVSWSLAVLLAVLSVYSAWALLGWNNVRLWKLYRKGGEGNDNHEGSRHELLW